MYNDILDKLIQAQPNQYSDHRQSANDAKELRYMLESAFVKLKDGLEYVNGKVKLHGALAHIRSVTREMPVGTPVLVIQDSILDKDLKDLVDSAEDEDRWLCRREGHVTVGAQYLTEAKRNATVICDTTIKQSPYLLSSSWTLVREELAEGEGDADPVPRENPPPSRYQMAVAMYWYGPPEDYDSADDEDRRKAKRGGALLPE